MSSGFWFIFMYGLGKKGEWGDDFHQTVLLSSFFLTGLGAGWPFLLGGQAHWTVGLVATLISVSSIIAADTYAFLGGKVYGLDQQDFASLIKLKLLVC